MMARVLLQFAGYLVTSSVVSPATCAIPYGLSPASTPHVLFTPAIHSIEVITSPARPIFVARDIPMIPRTQFSDALNNCVGTQTPGLFLSSGRRAGPAYHLDDYDQFLGIFV